jgi:hypothetical protein
MDAVSATDTATLGFGLSFAELRDREGLVRLDRRFLDELATLDGALHARLLTARAAPDAISGAEESALVVALAPHLDAFTAALFRVEAETLELARQTHELDPIHACKRLFVQRQAVKKYPDPSGFDGPVLRAALQALFSDQLTERRFADHVAAWEKAGDAEALDLAMRYASWATLTKAGRGASREHAVPGAAPFGLQPPRPGRNRRA